MKLTVLGNNGPFPGPGGACSGYLLQEGDSNLLLDCGNGVLANLQKIIPLERIDAIILTHLHSDHTSDLLVLKYAVEIKRKRGQMYGKIQLYAPPEPQTEYERLNAQEAFVLRPLDAKTELSFGNMKLTFREMKHPVKTFAISVDNGSHRLVFSGDTAWTEEIVEFSKHADLVMLDAGLLTRDKTGENVPHMTAAECGRAAKEAGAGKLLLTHFWPGYDLSELLEEAKQNFNNVELTEIMRSYEI